MSSEQPSLFDQLTPSDSLRDDLEWIDSLQEDTQEDDKPARQERKPCKRRGRKNIPTGYDRRDDAQTDEPTPPPPPAKPEHEPEQPMLIVPDMTQTDEPIPLAGLEAPTTVIGPGPESETAILPEEVLEDVADPDAPSGDSKAMTWVKRGLIIAGAAIMLLIILALAGSHSTAVKEKTAYERVQASMSQLAACNDKAKTTVGDADKAGVDDKDVDTLRDLVASNGKLIRSKRAGLSISESERLSTKADKATKRTRTLAGKVDRLVKAKPLTDARRKCRDALDKAVKASTDAKPSDDATRAAKTTLDKLIGQARKLDAKTTVDTWNDMASKLDKRAGTSPRHWTRKPKPTRKPDGRPKRRPKPNSKPRNSNSRRCPRRHPAAPPALPAQAPPACRKATAEEPRTTTMAEHPTATPADGTCHRKPTTTVCRATTQASDKRERSTTMGKNKHRQASTPESKKQAAVWCAIAIIAITVMVLVANPWKQQTSTTSTPQSSQSAQTRSHKQNKKKKTTKPSGTLQQQAQSMFIGGAEQIADDVRDLLNAPENSNVDTLGNLLYRHNRQDLAEATDLYDAIGRGET